MNAPTAKPTPPTRPSASAWLDTSIATVSVPRSCMTASRACSSGASGVVNPVFTASSPIIVATVPISPHWRPAASSPARTKYVVVVLPLVPVTPRTAIAALGRP